MYRNPANPLITAGSNRSSRGDDAIKANELFSHVCDAFPDLEIGCFWLDDSGGDHALLIVNDTHAFRFPRAGVHSLDLERKVLRRLQIHLALPTPRYDYVDPDRRFGGYRLIAGTALTPERFAWLSADQQRSIISRLACFLKTLHQLEPLAIAPLAIWPLAWNAGDYARRSLGEALPLIQNRFPHLGASIAEFFETYRSIPPSQLVVVHGDLVDEHILLDEETKQLAGIIDFGDVALGDPAQDILGCWAYGSAAVAQLIAQYGSDDGGLLGRSRNHFIRYRIDRLAHRLRQGLSIDALERDVSELETQLSACPC